MKLLAQCVIVMPGIVLSFSGYSAKSRFDHPHESVNPFVEDYEWSEEVAEIPAYPKKDNLLEFRIDLPGSITRMALSMTFLFSGAKNRRVINPV